MEISYCFLDPSKNMTVLVETPVDIAQQPQVAAAVMAAEPLCEQVGFISGGNDSCDIALRMAGGEFCGNAAMSAAVLRYKETGKRELKVSVSGCSEPVSVSITERENAYTGTVKMPMPSSVENGPYPLVKLPGISHIICEKPMERDAAELFVRSKCHELGADALGLMLLDEAQSRITPLVYVPLADTIFWEQSCASGTTAVGVYLSEKYHRPVEMSFSEPGSSLSVSAAPGHAPKLTGTVKIVYEKTIEI